MAARANLSEFLDDGVLNDTRRWAEIFSTARPFRHVVIDNFLDQSVCQSLVDEFPAFDRDHAINENAEVGGKATRENVTDLGPAYTAIDALARNSDFRKWVGEVTGIDDLNYDPYYFGGGTHENQHGQELDPHIDFNYHPISRQHRRLNLIVYLNPEWQVEWGGALQLHRDPHVERSEDEIVTVSPLMNRCVIFETTEHSWHGFEIIDLPQNKRHLSRKSFALYFYTRQRPAEETAGQHSTIYVERPLPEHFLSGRTLDESDVHQLKNLLARRDQHLQRLYSDIQSLKEELNDIRYPGENEAVRMDDDSPMDLGSAALEIERLRTRVVLLETSTSWRLTAPLRAIKRAISGG